MKWITKFMHIFHRIVGTVLSILFVMWFLTGFVMIYHGFPRIRASHRLARQELLTEGQSVTSLLPLDSVLSQLPEGMQVEGLSLKRENGRTVLTVRSGRESLAFPADTLGPLCEAEDDEASVVQHTLAVWSDGAPVARIDTLTRLDQWIPFGQMKKELPIYKFYLDDEERHQLYIGSQTGEPLNYTTRSQRIWAWLGAIPHWVYFTRLRQDVVLWRKVVEWLSGIGCLMVIAGLWVGIDTWRKTSRRRAGGFSPYKKKWYHWHYVTGLIFGIFALTFAFSGMMSLADIPSWISSTKVEVDTRAIGRPLPAASAYTLDYRDVLANHPEAKQLDWSAFNGHAYYTITGDGLKAYIDATSNAPMPLDLIEEEVNEAILSLYNKLLSAQERDQKPASTESVASEETAHAVALQTTLLDHFDTYYRGRSTSPQELLPVWKVTTNDADHSTYYVNPRTAAVRRVTTTSRWEYWVYPAMHSLRIGALNTHEPIRQVLLWILLLGGTAVSVTGIVLAVNYLRRLICRQRRRD